MSEGAEDKKIKIIAEGPILEALKKLLGGVSFKGSVAETGDRLVVYHHALVGGSTRRGMSGGLKKLQQILSNPLSGLPLHIHVLCFTPLSDLGRYSYLLKANNLISISRAPDRIELIKLNPTAPKDWRRLTRIASEEELELSCASYRHGLRSLMAAGRIYMGAAIIGHIEIDRCESVLKEFEARAKEEDPLIALNVSELLKLLKSHRRFHSDYGNITGHGKSRLWVLDDNWETHGWSAVFNDLPLGNTRGFKDWNALEKEMTRNAERPTVLMVDCNLGDGANVPTGLELLRPIRSRWPEVRVVFATAYDDAALALTSLREGANVFFAKALHDADDRQSKDYYLHLLKVLKPHPVEADVSRLWRNFIEGSEPTSTSSGGSVLPQPPTTLAKTLRLGFYLLFSMIDDELWWRGREWKQSDEGYLYRAVINLIRTGFPEIKNYFGVLPPKISKVLKGGPHGGAPITFSSLQAVLTYLLEELDLKQGQQALKSWSRPWPDHWPYRSPAQLQTDSSHPGLSKDVPLAPHELADSQGALELARGRYCNIKCKHTYASVDEILNIHPPQPANKLYEDIVFVDDRGDLTGWFAVVRAIFPGCRTFARVDDFLAAPGAVNLLILDLRLPSLEMGRAALQTILKWDGSVPVLTISAGHDSLAAIRSLRDGAIDFLSKTLPGPRDLDGCFLFADEFVNKCKLLREYGQSQCRRSWRQLHQLRQGPKWEAGALKNAKEKVMKCRKELEHLTEGVGFSALLIPPEPNEWARILADEIALLLRLRQQIFCLHEKNSLKPDAQRLNYKREYQILPVDYWRWEHVIFSSKVSYLVKLSIILAGVVVERLAQWNWSLSNLQPLNPYLWGAPVSNGIVIRDEVASLEGTLAWTQRNEALQPSASQREWSQALCDEVIKSVIKALSTFYARHGASLPWSNLTALALRK